MADRVSRAARRHPVIHTVLVLGSAVMVLPFCWQLLTSLKTYADSVRVPPRVLPAHPHWASYADVFHALPLLRMFGASVILAVIEIVAHVLFCAMAGYAFARVRFPGRDAIFLGVLAVLMVPPELFMVPQYEIVRQLGALDTLQGVFLPGLFSAFGTFLLRQFFRTLPVELEEAARIDGASPFRIFWRVMLPLARPGLLALGVFTVLYSWRSLLWPLVVISDQRKMPLPVGLATLQGEYFSNYPLLMAGATLAMLPILVLFMFLQRQFIQGIAFTGSK